jgi:multimeric flavodoxin WrbA
MKVTLLNGFDIQDHGQEIVHDLVTESIAHQNWHITTFTLQDLHITHCRGCFDCWTKRPGLCKFNDAGQDISRALISSNLAVLLTPVTFGGYSAELKKALDRVICLLMPFFTTIEGEVHHQKRYKRYPHLIGIGTLPGPAPQSEAIFRTLVQRNALNMHSTAHSAIVYLNKSNRDDHQANIQNLFAKVKVPK